MSVSLHVAGPRWRAHLDTVHAAQPGLIPVIKGNGYGFGCDTLARQAQRLGVGQVAVYDDHDAHTVRKHYSGTIITMAPWLPGQITRSQVRNAGPLIRTLSHADAVRTLATSPHRDTTGVLIEGLTSMQRHGIALGSLGELRSHLNAVQVNGFALHLPLPTYARGGENGNLTEATKLLDLLAEQGFPDTPVYLSHLNAQQLDTLQQRFPQMQVHNRVGTALWLADRSTYQAQATVLEVRHLGAGTPVGYRQKSSLRPRTVLIVSGGTAHGIGLTPVGPETGAAQHTLALLKAVRTALIAPSPFLIEGRHARFVEPPHIHVSAIVLPSGAREPRVGEQIGVRVRMTVTHFDQIVGVDDQRDPTPLPAQLSSNQRYVPLSLREHTCTARDASTALAEENDWN